MAKRIKGLYKIVLGFLITLLGFSSCSKHNNENEVLFEYGTPYEKLKLSGSIVDKNNNPVQGVRVQVKMVHPGITYNPHVISAPITDSNGIISDEIHQTVTDSIQIVFKKVGNTEKAQLFKDDSIKVKKVRVSDKKEGWMTGEAEASFSLKLKDN